MPKAYACILPLWMSVRDLANLAEFERGHEREAGASSELVSNDKRCLPSAELRDSLELQYPRTLLCSYRRPIPHTLILHTILCMQ